MVMYAFLNPPKLQQEDGQYFPLGFKSLADYHRSVEIMYEEIKETDVVIGMKGSSVRGTRHFKKRPGGGTSFDYRSDLDIGIASISLLRTAIKLGQDTYNEGRRTKPMGEWWDRGLARLGLENMKSRI